MPASTTGTPQGPAHGFSAKDHARVGAVVRQVEHAARFTPSKDSAYPYTPPVTLLIPAKTKSGGITAGSQSSPSTNSVTLMIPSGSGDGITADVDVDTLNYSTQTRTGAGKLVWLTHFNGKYILPFGDC